MPLHLLLTLVALLGAALQAEDVASESNLFDEAVYLTMLNPSCAQSDLMREALATGQTLLLHPYCSPGGSLARDGDLLRIIVPTDSD